MNSGKTKKIINLSFLFILLIVVLIGVIISEEINNVYKVVEDRKEHLEVVDQINMLFRSIESVGDYQKRFLLTEDSTFMDKYYSSKESLYAILSEIEKNKSEDIDTLSALIAEKLERLDTGILEAGKKNKAAVLSLIKSGQGAFLITEIKRIGTKIEKQGIDNFIASDSQVTGAIKKSSITAIVGMLIVCVLFLVVYYLLLQQVKERRKSENAVRIEKEFSERLLESSIDGIIAFDRNLNFTLFNKGIQNLTGCSREDAIGKNILEVFPFLKDVGEEKNLKEVLEGKSIISRDKWFYIPRTDRKGYFEAYYSPIMDNRQVIGGLAIVRNTTRRKLALESIEKSKEILEQRVKERTRALVVSNEELKKEISQRKEAQENLNLSLKEKTVLLREIHHRVKNNLQVISSLLNLQSTKLKDEDALEVIRESRNRIRSMALIHEKLYQSKDLNKIKFSDYLYSLSDDLFRSYNIDSERVQFVIEIDGIFLHLDTTILCGLIVNELISNTLKHAFPPGKSGQVYISVKENNKEEYKLVVKDNGIGFPETIDYQNTESLGLQLVNTLTQQLGGKINLKRNGFTEFEITFSERLEQPLKVSA